MGAGLFWSNFKISILVSLYGSDWFDLAAAMQGCLRAEGGSGGGGGPSNATI